MNDKTEELSSSKYIIRKIGLAVFLVLFIGLLLYRIFLSYTPFWLDFIVICIGAVIFIFAHEPASVNKMPTEKIEK